MNQEFYLTQKNIYKGMIYSFLFALWLIFLLDLLWVLLVVLVSAFLYLKYGEGIFLIVIIAALLTITSTINVQYRQFVQYSSLFVLSILFIRNYGVNFNKYPAIPYEIGFILISVILSMIISIAFSEYKLLGVNQLVRLSIFFLIVYFIYSILQKNIGVKWILISLLIVFFVYSISLYIDFVQSSYNMDELTKNQVKKLSSDYINTNTFGSFLIITISISISFFFGADNDRNQKLSILSLILLQFVMLFLSNSRAAILSTSICISFLYLYKGFEFRKLLYSLFLLLVLYLVFPIDELIRSYFRLRNLSTGRDLIYEAIYYVIKDNPIIGVGPAATKNYLYHNLPFMLGSSEEKFISFHYNQIEFGHAHNFYLFYWSDMGIPGLITSILIPIFFFKLCIKAMRKTKNLNNDYYLLSLGIFTAGIGLFIRAFFEWGNIVSYGSIVSDLPFWLIIILLCYIVQNRISREDYIFIKHNSFHSLSKSGLEKYFLKTKYPT